MAENVPAKNSFRLDGKTAVVTGAASGIGRATALCFGANGATVRIVDVNAQQAQATVDAILAGGGKASLHLCDVTSSAKTQQAFQEIRELGPIHALVNCAGIAHIGTLESTTDDDFDRVYRVNVLGTHHCMRAAVEAMVATGGGSIVNLASIAATAGLADRYAYSMSKGAVLSMTYSVARDFVGKGIRCNAISPARVHTEFVDGFVKKNYPGKEKEAFARLAASQPIGRMADPAEVAQFALYLCSDAASFLTGQDYAVDGGFLRLHG